MYIVYDCICIVVIIVIIRDTFDSPRTFLWKCLHGWTITEVTFDAQEQTRPKRPRRTPSQSRASAAPWSEAETSAASSGGLQTMVQQDLTKPHEHCRTKKNEETMGELEQDIISTSFEFEMVC